MQIPVTLLDAIAGLDLVPRTHRWTSVSYCLVDAVWSIGVGYDRHVVPAVRRVADAAGDAEPVAPVEAMPDVDPLPVSRFLDTYPTPDALRQVTTAHRTSSRGGILKAEAAVLYARALHDAGIDTLADAGEALADRDRVDALGATLRAVPGDGVRTDYFWMLVGDDDAVKPDRAVLRFLAQHGMPTVPAEAVRVLRVLASLLSTDDAPVTPWMVDHAIWQARLPRR